MVSVADPHPAEERLCAAFLASGLADSRGFLRRMTAQAIAAGITYEDPRGRKFFMNYGLLPVVVRAAALARLGRVARGVAAATARLARAWHGDTRLQTLLPLWPEEAALVRELAPLPAGAPVVGRLDASAVLGRRDGSLDALAYEWNGSCVGGIHYSPAGERLLEREVLPRLRRLARPPIRRQPELRDLVLRALRAHAARAATPGAIAVLEDTTDRGGITEYPALAEHFRRRGVDAVHGDLRDLDAAGGELWLRGRRVGVVLRNFELRDLVAIERRAGRLPAVREAFGRDRIVSAVAGDFDHKSLWEVLADPAFPAAGAAEVSRHLPWTRLVFPRRTSLPGGQTGDLLEHARRHREQLVLKPNRACGGMGVTLGASVTQATWERTLDRAESDRREGWVVQAAIPATRKYLPLLHRTRGPVLEETFVNYGVLVAGDGAGLIGRVCARPIVNVSRGGAQMAMFLG